MLVDERHTGCLVFASRQHSGASFWARFSCWRCIISSGWVLDAVCSIISYRTVINFPQLRCIFNSPDHQISNGSWILTQFWNLTDLMEMYCCDFWTCFAGVLLGVGSLMLKSFERPLHTRWFFPMLTWKKKKTQTARRAGVFSQINANIMLQ